jgi:multicomponent Na+:H+ antiporter subunit D
MTISLDTDWLWRRLGPAIAKVIENIVVSLGKLIAQQKARLQDFIHRMAVNYLGQPHTADSKERGMFARSWRVGTTALWIAILLSAYVFLHYLY